METTTITTDKTGFDFDTARKVSEAVAKVYNPETSLVAWFDKKQNKHSPSQVECDAEGLPGWEETGEIMGGRKRWCSGTGNIFLFIPERVEA